MASSKNLLMIVLCALTISMVRGEEHTHGCMCKADDMSRRLMAEHAGNMTMCSECEDGKCTASDPKRRLFAEHEDTHDDACCCPDGSKIGGSHDDMAPAMAPGMAPTKAEDMCSKYGCMCDHEHRRRLMAAHELECPECPMCTTSSRRLFAAHEEMSPKCPMKEGMPVKEDCCCEHDHDDAEAPEGAAAAPEGAAAAPEGAAEGPVSSTSRDVGDTAAEEGGEEGVASGVSQAFGGLVGAVGAALGVLAM